MDAPQTDAECPHNIVTRWHFLDDGSGNAWACVECRRRFEPVAGEAAVAAERERCAKVCKMLALEADGDIGFRDGCHECADGIRGLTDPPQ